MIRYIETAPFRGSDDFGSGDYGASRGDRPHYGIDFALEPGKLVLSPCSGTVTKLGYTYSDDLYYRYVEVTDVDGYRHRVFYITPRVEPDAVVTKNTVIGSVQDVTLRHNAKDKYMRPHVHYEVKRGKRFYNPAAFGA